MQKVTIYTETTLKGPALRKGSYAAVIEYICRNGEPATLEIYGTEEETTFHRSALLAIVKALGRLRNPCEVEVITGDIFIINTMDRGNPEGWKRQEWKKASGEEVKNKELWQQFLEEKEKHKIAVAFSKTNVYSKFLLMKMREKNGKKKKM